MAIKKIWVLAESMEAVAQLCAGARGLGEEVSVVLLGSKSDAEKTFSMGADKVYWLGEQKPEHIYENYFETISKLAQREKPGLVMVQASKRGSLVAGKLAAGFSTSVLVDAGSLEADDNHIKSRHMVYGGAAFRTEKALTDTAVVTVAVGEYAALAEDPSRKGEFIEIDFIEPERSFKLVSRNQKGVTPVNLRAAKRVVGVGRGIASEDDIKMVEELSALIDAEVACSRPLAEGVNWMPKERYIGISGAMIKPDVYFAVGISGQVQHMVGVSQARVIISINTDKNAPIFRQSDYGIVGDLYKVVPALMKKFKGNA